MTTDSKSSIKVKVLSPKEWAAGVPAVVSAYKNVSAKVGPIKGTKLLADLNQIEGFDCPGCAWPDPLGERSTFEFCENGAKAVADEATLKRLSAGFFAKHSIEQLRAKSDRWLNDQGRLVQPMWLEKGSEHYQPISWEQAFGKIVGHLNGLADPNQAAFYTSGRTSNEAAFLYQLMVRCFGTNNLPDCSNMCHESSGTALNQTIGVGKGTVTLEDFEHAQVILIFGQNPGSNHPRMLSALQKAKRNGAKIVSINPLDETGLKRFKNPQEVEGVIGNGTALRDIHLAVKINGDLPLIKGLCKVLLTRHEQDGNVLDSQFIEHYCSDFEAFADDIHSLSWQQVEAGSGLSQSQIEAVGELLASKQRIIGCWAMGMTQHKNSVAMITLITNLLMMKGSLGKPGSGVCPVRGHSNVQGDRTMGIWEKPTEALLSSLAKHFCYPMPQAHGVDTVDCIKAMAQGKIKVFFALGGNFFRAAPDHDKTGAALSQCDLTVQVSTKLNRSHLYTGKEALILPTLGRTELDIQAGGPQTVTVENSMGVVQTSRGKIPPASDQLKSEVNIIAELANGLFGAKPVDWLALCGDYRLIRDHIEQVIDGFDNFNQRLSELGEFVLPNPVRDSLTFRTENGKARFIVQTNDWVSAQKTRLLLMTLRSHDQFNTTVYTDDDRYRGVFGSREVIFMNPEDMEARGLEENHLVDINSFSEASDAESKCVKGYRVIPYGIPKGCVAAYYPEVNNLVHLADVALHSNTPAYKSVLVEVSPTQGIKEA